jgi:hypothetical protein
MEDAHVVPVLPAADLAIATAMVEELEDYIIEDELFRTVGVRVPGSGDMKIKMTGGDLLTRLYRLKQEQDRLTPEQRKQYAEIEAEARTTIYSLKTRFHQRLQREIKSRLDSLRWFIDETSEDMARGRANYPFEIRNRQRIEEILKELDGDIAQELAAQIASVDGTLGAMRMGPEFVWDPSLRSIFPQKPYWYLYAAPARP